MFKKLINRKVLNEQDERERLSNLSEKELLIEIVLELKKIDNKCDDIARKIVIWGGIKPFKNNNIKHNKAGIIVLLLDFFQRK